MSPYALDPIQGSLRGLKPSEGSIHFEFGPRTRTHEAFDAGGIPLAGIHTCGFFVTDLEELFGQPTLREQPEDADLHARETAGVRHGFGIGESRFQVGPFPFQPVVHIRTSVGVMVLSADGPPQF